MALLRFDERPAPGWFLALRTFRSDGTGVVTPVWSVELDGRRYVLTPARSGEARRVRAEPRVETADADFAGTALGPWSAGRASIVDGPAAGRARRALRRKYGLQYVVFRATLLLGRRRRAGGPGVVLVIDPVH